jgi:outer membrane protein assembly factor BamB
LEITRTIARGDKSDFTTGSGLQDPATNGNCFTDLAGHFGDRIVFRHSARILALALISVNAVACVPPETRGPISESRWTVYRGDASRSSLENQHLAEDPTPFWSTGTGRGPAASIAIGDSVIAIQETAKRLTIIWRHSGVRAWRASLRGGGSTVGPLIADSLVLAGTGGEEGHIYGYRLETGREEWNTKFPYATGPMAIEDSTIFAVSETGVVIAMDVRSGDEIWETRLGGRILGGLVLVGERLVVATVDSVISLDAETGATERSSAIPAQVRAPAAVAGGLIVFTSPEGIVFALDQRTLEQRWEVDLGEPMFGGAAIARDTVFATSVPGKLWKIPLADGVGVSSVNLDVAVRASPVPIDGGVLVSTLAGEVLRLEEGIEPTWGVRVDGPLSVAPILNRGVLFVVDGRGKVHTWH